MSPIFISLLVLALAALHLRDEAGRWWTKALTTITILILAATLSDGGRAATAILIGLGCSLVGDILLGLQKERFRAGLAAFLVAHLAYLVAFAGSVDGAPLMAFLPYAVAGVFVMRLLWPHLEEDRAAVLVYVVVLGTTAGSALAWAVSTGGGAWLAALGMAVFTISDSALAINRYVGELPRSETVVLGTYWIAQSLIAWSLA